MSRIVEYQQKNCLAVTSKNVRIQRAYVYTETV